MLQPITQTFVTQKQTAGALRRQRARDAMKANAYQPPIRPAPAPAQPPKLVQADLRNLFGLQMQRQQLAAEQAVVDMEEDF